MRAHLSDGIRDRSSCRRASNAPQRLALFWLAEDRGPSVVQQNNVEVLGAVSGGDTAPERSVGVHALTGCRSSENLQHNFKILESRQDLLDTGKRDEGLWQSETHPAIALRFDDGHSPGIRNQEIGPTYCSRNLKKLATQIFTSCISERVGIVRKIRSPHALRKNLSNLAAVNVQRRNDDVRRFFVSQLKNDFGEICFEYLESRVLKNRFS